MRIGTTFFNTLVVQDDPSIWKLIETLQAECAPVTGVPFKIEVVLDQRKNKKDIHTTKKKTVTSVKIDFQELVNLTF